MCDGEDNTFCVQPGAWRINDAHTNHLAGLSATQSRNASNDAQDMRDILADYFVSEKGKVSWQDEYLHNTHDNLMRNLATVPR